MKSMWKLVSSSFSNSIALIFLSLSDSRGGSMPLTLSSASRSARHWCLDFKYHHRLENIDMARLVNIHSAVCKHEITKDGLKKKVPRERLVSMHLSMVHTACALKCYYVLFVIKRTHKCDDVYHISTRDVSQSAQATAATNCWTEIHSPTLSDCRACASASLTSILTPDLGMNGCITMLDTILTIASRSRQAGSPHMYALRFAAASM